ncbi:MAG: hypothetical protein HRT90_07955 [Candidatus Margulisbacteria bacterium]|nr:hypothetical protein [Candidatus Margulisiibacteriota bacterium]
MGIATQKHEPGKLFSNVPDDICNLFEKNKPKPKSVAKMLNFKREDISIASGHPLSTVRYNRLPADVLDRMTEWATAINLVANHFKDVEKTMLWFKIKNPMLGNMAPRDMIRMGRFKKLLLFINDSLEDNKH